MKERTDLEAPAALAHVATLAFVAARAAPPVGFPLALAGGVALARGGRRFTGRVAYGIALAAMVETAAIVGPSRLGGPLTQAATAPVLGRLAARGVSAPTRVAICAAIRFAYNAATTAFFIWVLSGGLANYTGAYETVLGYVPGTPEGPAAALTVTALVLLAWALAASVTQVATYGAALRRWPAGVEAHGEHRHPAAIAAARRFDPRAVAVAAVLAFCVLLAGTGWLLLAASAVWLLLAWAATGPQRRVFTSGLALGALLALSAFGVTLAGGEGFAGALAHGVRAALIVLVAAWLRGATGPRGFREVARRSLARMRRLPSAREASAVIGELGPERRLGAAAGSLVQTMRGRERGVRGAVLAALGWIAAEAGRFRAMPAASPLALRLRPADAALAASACLPLLALLAG